jgi:hypothetical protein
VGVRVVRTILQKISSYICYVGFVRHAIDGSRKFCRDVQILCINNGSYVCEPHGNSALCVCTSPNEEWIEHKPIPYKFRKAGATNEYYHGPTRIIMDKRKDGVAIYSISSRLWPLLICLYRYRWVCPIRSELPHWLARLEEVVRSNPWCSWSLHLMARWTDSLPLEPNRWWWARWAR